MKISVFGAGYVGLVTGTCLSELGNNVIIVDIDKKRVDNLNEGIIPIYEPGLSEMIKSNVKENRLNFTLDAKDAIQNSDVVFIAVGTPDRGDGKTDLSYVLGVAKTIGQNINSYKVVIDKSTVPVGTGDLVKQEIKDNMEGDFEFDIVSNPEFLKEGSALRDFMAPDRVVIGCETEKAKEILNELYSGVIRVDRPIFFTDVKSAEIIKYSSNAMLACRISFMNQLSHLSELVGADIKDIATGMGMDKRIGSRFLQAGVGYGGSCFPKDVKSLANTMKEKGLDASLMDCIDEVNEIQKISILPKIKSLISDFNNKKIGVWGLAFKPKTDDMREAPSIPIINQLIEWGANISAFDPKAQENSKELLKGDIDFVEDPMDCVKDAEALIVLTEWDEFRNPNWDKIKTLMSGKLIVDGRNIYTPKTLKEKGFDFIGVGRG